MVDSEYRHCIDVVSGSCEYVRTNEYGTYYCSLDKIVQVEFYGCIPEVERNE